ncbi:MAG: ABC transporter ATP-binding protein [Aigarchaeota archaeon]|nr:ABC transporter ATP-binding protein [Aigarchaeota archaeon]
MTEREVLLKIEDLKLNFHTYRGEVKALNGADLTVYRGEVLSLVGESGCGKSTAAHAILRLLPDNAYILGGRIIFRGEDLLKKSGAEIREIRAKQIAMIFQDPMTYLNPVLTAGTQLREVFDLNEDFLKQETILSLENPGRKPDYDIYLTTRTSGETAQDARVSKGDLKATANRLSRDFLTLTQLPDPERIMTQYPHELSGGMRQRVMIAMALARRPYLLIADEITSALDVTVQAQILQFLKALRDKTDAAILFITHDLSVAAELSDRIAVMYGGNVVEVAPTAELFQRPLHPYTQLLQKSIPDVRKVEKRLDSIPGFVPDMISPPSGCRFHPRCPYAREKCHLEKPPMIEVEKGRFVACYNYEVEAS